MVKQLNQIIKILLIQDH